MLKMFKDMPSTRDGKMVFGLFAAYTARLFLNKGIETLPENTGDGVLAFLIAGFMLFVLLLSVLRYNTERPLFEPFDFRR